MNVIRKRPLFYKRKRSNIYRVFLLLIVVIAGGWLVTRLDTGAIRNPFEATPTATRTSRSLALEGEAFFEAGYLEAAITAYNQAAEQDPNNAQLWAELARIQVYSSNLLTTDGQRKTRLEEALYSIDQAVVLAPDNSTVHAIRAFVLDWSANPALAGPEAGALLLEAELEAVRALQIDPQNVLAQAFFAEILVDQQKWSQAEVIIVQAVARDATIMDVHRVYAYVLESTGRYRQAIEEYERAIEINPNLTFLYIAVGKNYRTLASRSDIPSQRNELYESALEYFARAANLNDQLGIQDPLPYLAITNTYRQKGEFFAASQNALKALSFDPANPDIYGQLGLVYRDARNFETAIFALKCAVRGCTPEESCEARNGCGEGETGVQVTGLALSPGTVVYYYTYGSLLAALSRSDQNYCPDAVGVLTEVQTAYGADATIAAIVDAGLQICASLEESLLSTPTPVFTPTPLPTPRQ
ncbi:MAG: tetratricopeptide repeat protein [Chloroflexota bacterium]